MWATRQDRLAAGDKTDPRIPIGGTPGFVAFTLRGGVRLDHNLRIGVRLENLTDQTFRTHGRESIGRAAFRRRIDWAY